MVSEIISNAPNTSIAKSTSSFSYRYHKLSYSTLALTLCLDFSGWTHK
jgi:hypothetical protein